MLTQWPLGRTGKRYFEVDDERGILYYFRTRSAQEWEEPARHFLLSTLLCACPPQLPTTRVAPS